MGVRRILPPWDSQPQESVRANPDIFPEGAEVLFNAGSGLVNLATDQLATVSGNPTVGVGVGGKSLNIAAGSGSSYGIYWPVQSRSGAQPWTIITRVRFDGPSTPNQGFFQIANVAKSGSPFIFLRRNSTDLAIYAGGNYRISESATLTQGSEHCIAAVYDGSTLTLIRNGNVIGTPYSSANLGSSNSSQAWIGNGYNGAAETGTYEAAYALYAIPVSVLLDVTGGNYWSLFAPRSIYVPVSAGGGATNTTVSGSLGVATASGLQGTVQNSTDTTVTGSLGTASASGLAATVGANRAIAGGLGTASASGLAATIGVNRGIDGALGTAVASGLQGTVNNTNDTIIGGGLGAATASGLSATVNANRTIAGALGTAVASGLQGTVSNANDTLVNGSLGTASATGLSGAISWDRYIAGLLGDATASGLQGTVDNTPPVLPAIGHPASDTSNAGWAASTGSDLYAMIDEVTPDAADYIVATSTGAVCELALQNTVYPGTAAQKLSYRASSDTGSSLIVRLKNTGGAVVRTETQLLTPTDTRYDITLTAPEVAAIVSGALSVELESA